MSNPRLLLFTPCQSVVVDALTGKWTLFNTTDSISTPAQDFKKLASFLLPHPENPLTDAFLEGRYLIDPMVFVALWWNESAPEKIVFEQRLSVIAPDGRISRITELKVETTTPYHRVLNPTGPVSARMPGVFNYILEIRQGQEEWVEIGRYPVLLQEMVIVTDEENEVEEETPTSETALPPA